LNQLEAIHEGHPEISHQDVRTIRGDDLECGATRRRCSDGGADGLQDLFQELERVGIIVNGQNVGVAEIWQAGVRTGRCDTDKTAVRSRRSRAKKNSSGKGALIKGMSRRLPGELLKDPLFRVRLKGIMRRQAGIYALYDGDTPYYKGLTVNLLGRLGRHLRDRHPSRWDHFVIFRIKKVRYLKDIETLLHAVIDTKGNAVRGKVPKDANINHMLQAEVREFKKRLKTYEKALR
jgi:hypothetical protein